MANITWYDDERNLNSVVWIQKELELDSIVELYRANIKFVDFIEIINAAIERENVDLTSRKKEILQIFLENVSPGMRIIYPNGIKWDEEDKDILLQIAEKAMHLDGLPTDIDWSNKKDRIVEIASMSGNLHELDTLPIDFNDKKDEILLRFEE